MDIVDKQHMLELAGYEFGERPSMVRSWGWIGPGLEPKYGKFTFLSSDYWHAACETLEKCINDAWKHYANEVG